MTALGFTLFETTIGFCGLVWGENGIVGVLLPEASREKTRARLTRRYPDAAETLPPAPIRHAIDAIISLLNGEASDLGQIELDMEGLAPFQRRAYALARAIPPGTTLTYGEIARQLGEPEAARAVGQAMGQNPFPIIVPCHRVLGAGGKAGGFSAPGGLTTKARMLSIEGARIGDEPTLFERLPIAMPPRRGGPSA